MARRCARNSIRAVIICEPFFPCSPLTEKQRELERNLRLACSGRRRQTDQPKHEILILPYFKFHSQWWSVQICQTVWCMLRAMGGGDKLGCLLGKCPNFLIVLGFFLFFFCHKTEQKYRSACSSHRHEQVRWMSVSSHWKRRKKEKWRASLSEAHAMLFSQWLNSRCQAELPSVSSWLRPGSAPCPHFGCSAALVRTPWPSVFLLVGLGEPFWEALKSLSRTTGSL